MKYGIYYNDLFDSIIISGDDKEIKQIINKDNVAIIKGENDEILGFNIFEVSKDIHLKNAFNSFNKNAIEYIQKRLNGIFDFKQEKQFVVGKVLECEEIEGTHLHLCKIDVNDQILQIVCGAKNIAKDQLVVVALVGAWMPTGLQILPGKLRGHESFGMVCSARKLHLENNTYNEEGIIVLPESFEDKIGQDFFELHK